MYKWGFLYPQNSKTRVRRSRFEPHVVIGHHYASQGLLLLRKRKLITVTLFSHVVVQGVEEIIHEYGLGNIMPLGGRSSWASQGSLQHRVSSLTDAL